MNKWQLWIFISGLLLTLSCAEEKSRLTSRQYIDLSGVWSTRYGNVMLPGTTDEANIGDTIKNLNETGRLSRRHTFVAPITFSNTITIPKSFEGRHLSLIMERTKPSTLFIDGDSIGSYSHLYAPHIYDVTGLKLGEHSIEIRIDNSDKSILPEIGGSHAVSEHTQTNWNGILGVFRLEASDIVYIHSIQVYPSVERHSALVRTVVCGAEEGMELNMTYEVDGKELVAPSVACGCVDTLYVNIDMGDDVKTWSEWAPNLYTLRASLQAQKKNSHDEVIYSDRMSTSFGMRDFKTEGSHFVINGKRTFLRGKHDACVFPLTGYAPMTVEEWRKVFVTAKQYGINHYRFHSWAPPAAAFEAADIEGIYLQAELPYWGCLEREDSALISFLKREGEMLLDYVGTHPSFTMMAHGNELCGDTSLMHEWVNDFKMRDSRHLYAFGSNNFLGWRGQMDGEDFWVTCRAGGERKGEYNTHTRSSFSFADARDGGILNGEYPNTNRNYSKAIEDVTIPIISHETCQFQIYPDSSEIEKYTGVLRPLNHEIFRDRLKNAGLSGYAKEFHMASGELSMLCYKADIEMCLRTPNFGGFQLLDLQDYPGQGSALCAPLDAFMEPKAFISPEKFSRFCSELVPLALMDSYVMRSDSVRLRFAIANYTQDAIENQVLRWALRDTLNRVVISGTMSVTIPQGDVVVLEKEIAENISDKVEEGMSALNLMLDIEGHMNTYRMWVVKESQEDAEKQNEKATKLCYVKSLDSKCLTLLSEGKTVVVNPDFSDVEDVTVGGLFTPDYWNYAMFKSISESNNQPVSPGTLGYLIDRWHPMFTTYFATDYHSDWQWWIIAKNSRPLILDGMAEADSIHVIVRVIDNVERNYNLGIMMECRVEGHSCRLIICMTDLDAIRETLEGSQYIIALEEYALSEGREDIASCSWQQIQTLFARKVKHSDIQGVENISDYEQQN